MHGLPSASKNAIGWLALQVLAYVVFALAQRAFALLLIASA
jgi:hypothetical protein